MTLTTARSQQAANARKLVLELQNQLSNALDQTSAQQGDATRLQSVAWLRDGGQHGGGTRLCTAGTPVFNRASVNVSQVHYDDLAEKKLGSATALSAIVHPHNPFCPSVHIHLSWTEMKSGSGYWRIMADLNPAIVNAEHKKQFLQVFEDAVPDLYERAIHEGDRYFMIPALKRHRGVAHFYLEGYKSDDSEADLELAGRVGRLAIETYVDILQSALRSNPTPAAGQFEEQLEYHTLYLFQVLTLDRGTTAGLLVHDQNDLGILGSLPGFIDRELLKTWRQRLGSPQDVLLDALVEVLASEQPSPVDDQTKSKLATIIREHYRRYPEAIDLQASASVRPPTFDNHK